MSEKREEGVRTGVRTSTENTKGATGTSSSGDGSHIPESVPRRFLLLQAEEAYFVVRKLSCIIFKEYHDIA